MLELRYAAGTNETESVTIEDIGERIEVLPDRVLIYAHDGEAALPRCTTAASHRRSALVRRSSLEDVFLRLTGRTLVD